MAGEDEQTGEGVCGDAVLIAASRLLHVYHNYNLLSPQQPDGKGQTDEVKAIKKTERKAEACMLMKLVPTYTMCTALLGFLPQPRTISDTTTRPSTMSRAAIPPLCSATV